MKRSFINLVSFILLAFILFIGCEKKQQNAGVKPEISKKTAREKSPRLDSTAIRIQREAEKSAEIKTKAENNKLIVYTRCTDTTGFNSSEYISDELSSFLESVDISVEIDSVSDSCGFALVNFDSTLYLEHTLADIDLMMRCVGFFDHISMDNVLNQVGVSSISSTIRISEPDYMYEATYSDIRSIDFKNLYYIVSIDDDNPMPLQDGKWAHFEQRGEQILTFVDNEFCQVSGFMDEIAIVVLLYTSGGGSSNSWYVTQIMRIIDKKLSVLYQIKASTKQRYSGIEFDCEEEQLIVRSDNWRWGDSNVSPSLLEIGTYSLSGLRLKRIKHEYIDNPCCPNR